VTGASAAYTVKTAKVAGLGTVLVNGEGRTLYLLNSEAGGKLTCTDANGCTAIWPDTELPDGVSHGIAAGGVNGSLLGTVQAPDGKLYLTYGASRWPLYTFVHDTAPGQAHGQGLHTFGGVWSAITPAGDAATSSPAPTTTSSIGGY
jgi:predicted lipoprotein with Yx(FWY)xxD motif